MTVAHENRITTSGGFLPSKLAHRIDRRLSGDDQCDVNGILERVREAVRAGRSDVAAKLAEFGASIVATRGVTP